MKAVLRLCLILLLLWSGGLLWFCLSLPPAGKIQNLAPAEAIAVLTGGPGRLAAAYELLEQNKGERLLISGVYERTSLERVYNLLGSSDELSACCIDVGREAKNTEGNAAEIAHWAIEHGYKSLIVVTARTHMPRTQIELQRFLPDVGITPYAVQTGRFTLSNSRRLTYEYSKYWISLMRARLLKNISAT
ncbi:MAG: hypothetical protein CMF31_04425 [Kordiimonas sp.]|nr:hypothetical protein [Kordiimonas sp.]